MSLLSLLITFLLEQLRPLDYRRWMVRPWHWWADWIERHINAGSYRQGVLGLVLALGLPLLVVALVWRLLAGLSPLFVLLLNVAVLYASMGFRQFSHFYTDIQLALRLGDLDRARSLLAEWRDAPVVRQGPGDIARVAIETALIAAHRHIFAVLFCFVLFPGPLGALLYRGAQLLAEHWRRPGVGEAFGKFPQQFFATLDWLPQRATAAAFAVVGNFEDAVYSWRKAAGRRLDAETGIVLASGAGALGVRLGPAGVGAEPCSGQDDPGLGEPADVDFMQSATGLVWRAIVLWLLMLFLLGLASLVG